jgi:hypothetical protein
VKLSESNDEQTSEDEELVVNSQDSQQDNSDHDGDDSDQGANDDDNDDDDFVVQDDGEVIPELPMAFSRQSYQDTVHDFKVVCQLFVHLAMMPMDERRKDMEEVLNSTSIYASRTTNS